MGWFIEGGDGCQTRKQKPKEESTAAVGLLLTSGVVFPESSFESSIGGKTYAIGSLLVGAMRSFWVIIFLHIFVPSVVLAERPSIKVITTIQDGEGLTQNDMSMDMLVNIEELAKAEWLENAKQSVLRQGVPEEQFVGRVESSSHYVVRSGRKLGVVNLSYFLGEDPSPVGQMVRVFGFVEEGIAIVGCFRFSEDTIPIGSGPCGEEINNAFALTPLITDQEYAEIERRAKAITSRAPSEAPNAISVNEIMLASISLAGRASNAQNTSDYTGSEMLVIEFFKKRSLQLHEVGKIDLSKKRTAYYMAGQSMSRLGSLALTIKSQDEKNEFVSKLITHGKSYFPGEKMSDIEAISTAIIIACYKKLN